MKTTLIIFCVFVLLSSQALAKTNNPKDVLRCSYDAKGLYKRELTILKPQYFPWGVCVHHHDHLNRDERDWTREAMQIWNTKYENYKYNQWGLGYVSGIPEGSLFVESCNRNKYNIIYPKKEELYDPANGEDTIAYYKPYDYWWDFVTFYGVIAMDSNTRWNREHFINVMVHELGHALGIPHAPKGSSEFMIAKGFGCDEYDDNICEFTDYDWVVFLDPYNPANAETRANYEARMELEDKRILEMLNMGYTPQRFYGCSADSTFLCPLY